MIAKSAKTILKDGFYRFFDFCAVISGRVIAPTECQLMNQLGKFFWMRASHKPIENRAGPAARFLLVLPSNPTKEV
jgi:hypothetical protein